MAQYSKDRFVQDVVARYQRHMLSIARRSNAPIPIKGRGKRPSFTPIVENRRLKPSLPKMARMAHFCRVSMRVELNGELKRGAVGELVGDTRWLQSSKLVEREGGGGILRGKWGANSPMGAMVGKKGGGGGRKKETKKKETRNVGCLDALVQARRELEATSWIVERGNSWILVILRSQVDD